MVRHITLACSLSVLAGPALAAKGPFLSFANTDFVVLLGFIIFLAVLVYFKAPSILGGMLDQRATGISAEIEEAKALEEDAKTLLADYRRKQQDVQAQADRIVAQAKEEATLVAEQAKADLEASIARRLAAAEDQIANAQSAVVKEVRDEAISVAIAAAQDVIAGQMTAAKANALIDNAIGDVGAKLH